MAYSGWYEPKIYRKKVDFKSEVRLDGVALTPSAAELNILKDVTADKDEINVLDGITSSTAELNILTDVTADKDEINRLQGVTPGTAAANKALVAGANGNLDEIAIETLKLGAGAGIQVTADAHVLNSVVRFEGTMGYQTLELAAAVVEGDTVSFEHDGETETYEVKVLDQAMQNTADNAGGALTADLDDVDLEMTDDTHGLTVGELILIGTEVMRVASVADENLVVDRAQCGSTLAIHAQNQAVTNGLALAAAENIPIGFAAGALTNVVSSIHIPATFNENSALALTATRLADTHVLWRTNGVGSYAVTLAETFTEATNIWMGTWVDGSAPGIHRLTQIVHEVTAAEAAADQIIIPVNFAPSAVIVQLRDAGGTIVGFDGDVVIEATPNRVTLTNNTSVDFAATNVITLFIYE